jgi:hypothetical protein
MLTFAKSSIPINDAEWTPVRAAINCNYFGLKNADSAGLAMRTSRDDALTEDSQAFANGICALTSGATNLTVIFD